LWITDVSSWIFYGPLRVWFYQIRENVGIVASK
jgi:hypothetical protein